MSTHYVAAEDIGGGKRRWITVGWRDTSESAFEDASEVIGHDDFALYSLAHVDESERTNADTPE